eukprot:TRINITY_DN20022_c0_g1_i1.p1 TRINITY_DN20022_c0_g1~~TRINITY_DN20022_c0_g1_i1.p1  ORF type:complete len:199 (+),score=43.67 TRINITY_DN20022_c0_g1_i1:52-648(+)
MAEPVLYYFGIKARGQLPVILAAYGGVPLKWERDIKWPGMKEETPFGQLPYLVHGEVKIGQSMAIARYISRIANLGGDSDVDFAMSEQLIEAQNDIYNILAKAHYATDKATAWKTAIEIDLPKQWTALEKLLGDKPQFCSRILAGDLAIFSIINMVLDIDANTIDSFPKLKSFYGTLAKEPKFSSYLTSPPPAYFKKV